MDNPGNYPGGSTYNASSSNKKLQQTQAQVDEVKPIVYCPFKLYYYKKFFVILYCPYHDYYLDNWACFGYIK